jgi:hypothetical protein
MNQVVDCDVIATAYATRVLCNPSHVTLAFTFLALNPVVFGFLRYHRSAFVETLCDTTFGD